MRIQPAIYLLFTLFISIQVPAADEKRDLSGIAGEYGGTVKRVEMTLWATLVTGRSEEKALALLFFPAQQRQAQTERLRRLTDAFLASGQDRCNIANVFDQVYRPGSGVHPGLVLVHGGWEQQPELELRRFPEGYLMLNNEYVFLREREYMVKEVRRDPGNGELVHLRLTQTGFIQNFLDNPKLRLEKNKTATGGVELLASYVKAKFAAHNALNAALEGVPQGSVTPCP